jgi:hypothetical protein
MLSLKQVTLETLARVFAAVLDTPNPPSVGRQSAQDCRCPVIVCNNPNALLDITRSLSVSISLPDYAGAIGRQSPEKLSIGLWLHEDLCFEPLERLFDGRARVIVSVNLSERIL